MAAAVADVIEQSGTLLAEAGTGTGKTLAYLIPAILSRQRVLVSTGTKNLQEQIFFKDIPALRQALDIPFTATLMKGRGNYLCLHRWEMFRDGVLGQTSAGGRLIESGDRVLLPIIDAWLKQTTDGDRAELRDLPEDLAVWKELAAEADTCLGTECPRHGDCFVTLMRQRAAESDVVVVNHHLLCADAAVRQSEYGEVIPACPTLVVDEAHQLEDVATQYFGIALTNLRVDDLVRDTERLLASAPAGRGSYEALARLADASRRFFAEIAMGRVAGPVGTGSRARYSAEAMGEHADSGLALADALDRLAMSLEGGREDQASGLRAQASGFGPQASEFDDQPAATGETDEALAALERRAAQMRQDLQFLVRAADPDYVYFLEIRGRATVLRAAPIDVSRVVREAVLDRFRSVVLTSATL